MCAIKSLNSVELELSRIGIGDLNLGEKLESTQNKMSGATNNGIISPSQLPNNNNNNESAASATSTPAPETNSDDQKQNLKQAINSIDKTLGLLHQLYLTVSSFDVSFQLPLLQRINGLVMELDNMKKLSADCNIQVPMEVLNLIDEGKNPDEFTRDVLNSCIAKNQITKGKTDAFKSLRKHLLEELEQAFPDEVEAYRDIRASSAAEMRLMAQAQGMLPNGDVKIKNEP